MFEQRLDQLQRKLSASTRAGKPLPGYKVRVDALRAEISRLETLRATTPSESAGADPGVDTPAASA